MSFLLRFSPDQKHCVLEPKFPKSEPFINQQALEAIMGAVGEGFLEERKKVKVAKSCLTPWTIQSREFSRPEYWSG